jgi:hypothetical protein
MNFYEELLSHLIVYQLVYYMNIMCFILFNRF